MEGGLNGDSQGTSSASVYCDVCECTMTSQIIYDTHVQGARHIKNVKHKAAGGKEPLVKRGQANKLPRDDLAPIDSINSKDVLNSCAQPLIGIHCVYEVLPNKEQEHTIYACSMCGSSNDVHGLLTHLVGRQHRLNHMKAHYTEMHLEIVEIQGPKSASTPRLVEFATQIETLEGRTATQVTTRKEFKAKYPEHNLDASGGKGPGRGQGGDSAGDREGQGSERGLGRGRGGGGDRGGWGDRGGRGGWGDRGGWGGERGGWSDRGGRGGERGGRGFGRGDRGGRSRGAGAFGPGGGLKRPYEEEFLPEPLDYFEFEHSAPKFGRGVGAMQAAVPLPPVSLTNSLLGVLESIYSKDVSTEDEARLALKVSNTLSDSLIRFRTAN